MKPQVGSKDLTAKLGSDKERRKNHYPEQEARRVVTWAKNTRESFCVREVMQKEMNSGGHLAKARPAGRTFVRNPYANRLRNAATSQLVVHFSNT